MHYVILMHTQTVTDWLNARIKTGSRSLYLQLVSKPFLQNLFYSSGFMLKFSRFNESEENETSQLGPQ